MIYHLYFSLIMAGYSAISILLGSYMMHYTDATEIDLGFLFMIQPMTIFLRPFICAQADRYQSHRQLLAFFALLTSLSYIPFIALTFFNDTLNALETQHTDPDSSLPSISQLKFWSLVCFHTIGSVGFCGVRSLGDGLAVNYAKRIGADFARYRKYGSATYGLCGFFLGQINQNWLLPDFSPSLIMYSVSMITLAVLTYAWPQQYFIMSSKNFDDPTIRAEYIASLPNASDTLKHIGIKIKDAFLFRKEPSTHPIDASNGRSKWASNLTIAAPAGVVTNGVEAKRTASITSGELIDDRTKTLTIQQQIGIFTLLIRRDFRVLLYLLIMFYGGLVGYSGPNFVFTYIDVVCHRRGDCSGAQLTGLVIISYCCVETICYMIIDRFRGRFNRVFVIEITFVSLTIHYFFYGFLLEHLSPYYFLMESLHGVEYSISLTACVDLGYYFAREVELLLPELVQRGIVSQSDNQELVKVSLLATMSGCFTLVYDGFGCILGSLVFGIITGHYSFVVTWIVIGSLAVIGFVVILVGLSLGKCFGIRPEILRIKDRANQQSNNRDE